MFNELKFNEMKNLKEMKVYLVYNDHVPYDSFLEKVFSSRVDAEHFISEKQKVEIPDWEEWVESEKLEDPNFVPNWYPDYSIKEMEVE
jgi:hypothetical protein